MVKVISYNFNFKRLNFLGTNLIKGKYFHSNTASITTYEDPVKDKVDILKDNKDKCGIYKWTNKINGKTYIGSSVNLSLRISNYLSRNYLSKRVSIYNSQIYNALLVHNNSDFRLEILEYCDRSIIIEKEQYYIDKHKPEYNILRVAGSSLGFKHSEETLSKFKSRKLSAEALENKKKKQKKVQFCLV